MQPSSRLFFFIFILIPFKDMHQIKNDEKLMQQNNSSFFMLLYALCKRLRKGRGGRTSARVLWGEGRVNLHHLHNKIVCFFLVACTICLELK